MQSPRFTRRNMLLGTGASVASLAAGNALHAYAAQTAPAASSEPAPMPPTPDQVRRMQWWHAARFGMFIHFGLYSQHARHEWAMENEAIPVQEYMQFAKQFNPRPGCQRQWAKVAKAAGMKYMVMTTKHHEGFCNF